MKANAAVEVAKISSEASCLSAEIAAAPTPPRSPAASVSTTAAILAMVWELFSSA